ncbi:MAG TPA: hypothetical protein VIO33_00620 [Burkholderiaceae bacterium]
MPTTTPKPRARKLAPALAAAKVVKAKAKAAPPTTNDDNKAAKAKRVALVRDGFTMPESDFALIAILKARALSARREAKKSELLRAGLQTLAALDDGALVRALNRLEPIKIGRPKKGH